MSQNPCDTSSPAETKATTKQQQHCAKYNRTQKGRERQYRWKEKNPKLTWCITARFNAKMRAKKKGVPFDLSGRYIYGILPDSCPVFGTAFIFAGNKVLGPESPSLDRIDPAKGYVEGNLRILSLKANQIKNAFSAEDVMRMARWLEEQGQ